MKGDDFNDKFKKYVGKVEDGKWLASHVYDPRNSDRVEDIIHLDTDSRTTIEYLKALMTMTNELRVMNGLEALK